MFVVSLFAKQRREMCRDYFTARILFDLKVFFKKIFLCRFSLGTDLHGHALVAVIGGEEEHFEDFGESNSTSDLLLVNQEEGREAPEGEGATEPHPHAGSPVHRPPMLLSPRYTHTHTPNQHCNKTHEVSLVCLKLK